MLAWSDAPDAVCQIAGHMLEYACFGPAPEDAPTIILLHEGLGCVKLWRDFPALLAERTGLGVFAYSRAGYGASSPVDLPRPLNYMTVEAQEILPHLLEFVGAKELFLLGHSDGATIAAIYSGTFDDARLRGTILMAPHFYAEAGGLREIAKITADYNSSDFKSRMGKYHKNPDVAFRGWSDSWLHPDFKKWNVADCVYGIKVPVLAIQGRDDLYGSLQQITDIVHRSSGAVTLSVLEGCGHSPFLEAAEQTLGAIDNFIRAQREGS
jgi:pimeloyl-ACP methyl ester carboxylesterase